MKMKEWHRKVCKEGYCKICGKMLPENMLCGHHLKSKGSRPDLKFDVSNGICVCAQCHLKVHNGQITLTFLKKFDSI